ncbi:hypothetical protein FKX85_19720 [Echinicola soli]|uniref:Response regulator receiver domain-containing protein n=1 Tax=Echinicola soli TaxID=2591634 RepID=A0A514CMW4_9BACT|nr:hypothetical protein [Echinicola soli]QDH81138.1 hypothetical protein FKX85_19720 [Echinicola soli]
MKDIVVMGNDALIVDNLCEILALFGYGTTLIEGMDVALHGEQPSLIILDVPNGFHGRENIAIIKKILPFRIPILIRGYPDDLGLYRHLFDAYDHIHFCEKSTSVRHLEKILKRLVGTGIVRTNG